MAVNRPFQLENGKTYLVPEHCCLFCCHCTDVYYDWNGPYATICDKNILKNGCGLFEILDSYKDFKDMDCFEEIKE